MVEYLLLITLYTYMYVTHTYHKDIYTCIGIFAYNQTSIHTCTHTYMALMLMHTCNSGIYTNVHTHALTLRHTNTHSVTCI